jgi:hypothetical protein
MYWHAHQGNQGRFSILCIGMHTKKTMAFFYDAMEAHVQGTRMLRIRMRLLSLKGNLLIWSESQTISQQQPSLMGL